jgi:hypothetical protein
MTCSDCDQLRRELEEQKAHNKMLESQKQSLKDVLQSQCEQLEQQLKEQKQQNKSQAVVLF